MSLFCELDHYMISLYPKLLDKFIFFFTIKIRGLLSIGLLISEKQDIGF